jgi:hypothetical protein
MHIKTVEGINGLWKESQVFGIGFQQRHVLPSVSPDLLLSAGKHFGSEINANDASLWSNALLKQGETLSCPTAQIEDHRSSS